jgi:membrane-associated phospholipid phosphatase
MADLGDFQPRSFIGNVGYYGPLTMMAGLLTLLSVRKEYSMVVYVLLWQVANYYFNVVMKNTLQEPRPVGPMPTADIGYFERHKYYGMPSGHVQLVVSMGVFTLLLLQRARLYNSAITLFLQLLIVLQIGLTMWQRVRYQRHDLTQVLIGGGIGAALAVGFYYFFYINLL